MAVVSTTARRSTATEDRLAAYLKRRAWPLLASVAFVGVGLFYFFSWSTVGRHRAHLWIMPSDIWTTYAASAAVAHGHLDAVYGSGFLAYPGFLAVLAPLGALSDVFSTTFIQLTSHGHLFAGTNVYAVHGTPTILYDGMKNGGNLYAVHQGVFVMIAPVILLLSCTALFAMDALAERLGVDRGRRAVLSATEAVLMWSVTIVGGYPEDALALGVAIFALIWAFDDRFTGAGWLFGVAIAIQPLVIVLFPLLLVLGGMRRVLGLLVRGAAPAAVVVIGPLAADFQATTHALIDQPTFPNIPFNYRTLWTPLAPHLSGQGADRTVGGGPIRLVALAASAGIGWWSLRWRQRPEMIVWAAALALALRVYTESVMLAYYTWPALAVGVVIAARSTTRRFLAAVMVAVATTVVGQWQLSSLTWWGIQVVGVSALLALTVSPGAPQVTEGVASGPMSRTQGRVTESGRTGQKRSSAR